MLSPIIEQINGNIYIDFVRQLSHEVGHCYIGMLDCKVPPTAKAPPSDAIEKANKLFVVFFVFLLCCSNGGRKIRALSGIQYFQVFVLSFNKEGKEPVKLDPEVYVEYMSARVNIARL